MAYNLPNTNICDASFGSYYSFANTYGDETSSKASDYHHDFLDLNDWFDQDDIPAFSAAGYDPPPDQIFAQSARISNTDGPLINRNINIGSGRVIRDKVAFKTKSEIEVLDDGFKWRKYGKKMVKNSPNPRNYYKCSVESCPVKKRIERDKEDIRYVVTTYEGIHNHECPRNSS